MSSKIDFKKTLKYLYSPSSKAPVLVEVPEMQFLMIDGKGSPGDSREYLDAITSLYPIAFTLKFMSKKESNKDYVVPPLEGLWWAENMNDFIEAKRDGWLWIMMIMTPEWITKKMFDHAVKSATEKKPELSKSITKVRLERLHEGKSAQLLHIGPFSEEHENIMKIHEFIHQNGGNFDGHRSKHHEIYLSDPRKAKPETMKTIIRQPFELKK